MAAAIPSARWVPLCRAASFSMRTNLFTVGLEGAVAAVIVVVTVVAAKAAVIVGGRGCNFLKPGSVEACRDFLVLSSLHQTLRCCRAIPAPWLLMSCLLWYELRAPRDSRNRQT